MAIKSLNESGFRSLSMIFAFRHSHTGTLHLFHLFEITRMFFYPPDRNGINIYINPMVLFYIYVKASLIMVSVLKPKKSIFNKPAFSATELSNWVTSISLSFAFVTGTNFTISSGVMITPQACIPTYYASNLPARMLAFNTSASGVFSSANFLKLWD